MSRVLKGSLLAVAVAALCAAILGLGVTEATGRATRAHEATGSCAVPDTFPATRDPSNPLDLPVPPGRNANPLSGAQFFVDGPAHGAAAGAIASLVGLDPEQISGSETWGKFLEQLQSGSIAAKLRSNPGLAHKVKLLEKIAAEPEANRFSLYSGGGGPGAIYGQVQKIFCHNLAADPGS
ncbi:MAG TPA: hypothetical protein VG371_07465, partial [Solirubrobacteraceae bacterium]|nr:hypothetical protein [Solirubrobacteraceae bacterium]